MIKLFVGLGNPENKYDNTRHNFGFMVLNEIAKNKAVEFKNWNDMADISFLEHKGSKIFLLKPRTFMNNSGVAVSAFAKYYKIKPEEIFVFYDDFSIPLGEFRLRLTGSAGGHNGADSLITHLNSQNFPRMKLGIGPIPKVYNDTADFVLSKFHGEDKEKIDAVKQNAIELFDALNELGLEKAISKLSGKK
ncbi:aminoacyl-tRNA hydrolase [Endomicrobium proavitum]|uniref:Peptidyl-tRNA hydrolase n=1 Tax=Endomicrobium proavitum TaxID=1408281 RepID=A0A0G3WJW5_9BACT|nr:aminoacyl-tRNA hydrolase [Endomicrobium proavitum]AKL98593.1 Peptidyl-tRNA hydrolase [Endomicrobium proavitum]